MKYRTVIEVVAEAENGIEAIDIAGEFLRGNLESGVKMQCHSEPMNRKNMLSVVGVALILSLVIGAWSLTYIRKAPIRLAGIETLSACQPPLKTSGEGTFKDSWKSEESRRILSSIQD
jgi:hypothetical protein